MSELCTVCRGIGLMTFFSEGVGLSPAFIPVIVIPSLLCEQCAGTGMEPKAPARSGSSPVPRASAPPARSDRSRR